MAAVVFKKTTVTENGAKTDYGVKAVFATEEEARTYIQKQAEDKTISFAIAVF